MEKRFLLSIALIFCVACSADRPLQGRVSSSMEVTQTGGTEEAEQIIGSAVSQTPIDRDAEKTSTSESNRPPTLTMVKLTPEIFSPGDMLGVEASAKDEDGDDVVILYEWTFNGHVAGSSKRLEVPLKKGDHFAVKVTPFDGKTYGKSVELDREIVNTPPEIEANERFFFDGTYFEYQARAVDPDGDGLTYSLLAPPPGMTIVPTTGLIKWVVPEDFTGISVISVQVEDGRGGKANYTLNFTIESEEATL